MLIAALIETAIWLLLVWNGLTTEEPATRGLDRAAAILGSAAYALSAGPALALAVWSRRLGAAVVLVLLPAAALIVAVGAFALRN